jgi:hypothetical protein
LPAEALPIVHEVVSTARVMRISWPDAEAKMILGLLGARAEELGGFYLKQAERTIRCVF